ncbi:Serine/threonine-protein phosphatase 7 long form-like [Vitis vinifera]|uniref:Serine/threonine-protein phosphatase 7 long form-like n=1 Tax=Vitis vinifera TaxID=29760 RepID=A0A438HP48_VITVI|nr:Serine/threonine-protein phosphatase 7 long form-like [Vitis vinifera]
MFETTSSANSMYQAEPFFLESIGLVDFEDDFTTYKVASPGIREWGNSAKRASEEPTDCPITHRYVPDSPIESDRIMKLPVGVPEGAEKPAEEYENNKELIIEKERDVRGVSSHLPIDRNSISKPSNSSTTDQNVKEIVRSRHWHWMSTLGDKFESCPDVEAVQPATLEREEEFKKRYESWNDLEVFEFHYGSHHPSAGIAPSYLLRLPPFIGKGNTSDAKELIPEFFHMPEFLESCSNLDLGEKQSRKKRLRSCSGTHFDSLLGFVFLLGMQYSKSPSLLRNILSNFQNFSPLGRPVGIRFGRFSRFIESAEPTTNPYGFLVVKQAEKTEGSELALNPEGSNAKRGMGIKGKRIGEQRTLDILETGNLAEESASLSVLEVIIGMHGSYLVEILSAWLGTTSTHRWLWLLNSYACMVLNLECLLCVCLCLADLLCSAWLGTTGNDPGKLHYRRHEASFYHNSVLDAHIIPYLQQSGFYGVARLVSGNTCLDWREVCATLFGVVPEDRDISEQRLRLSWLTGHFPSLAPDADVEFVRCYARAFILQLIRGFLFADKSNNRMCRASRIDAHDALGPLILLQLWDRFPFITPMRLHSALHDGILPQPPLGMRWRDEFCTTSTPMHVLPQYRPDRVLRQFGLLQHIPEQCDTELGLHKYDLRGRHDLDWMSIHHHYIQRWEAKYDHLARAEATSTSYGYSHPYMVWYCSITRLFLTPYESSWEIVNSSLQQIHLWTGPDTPNIERQSLDEELVMRDGGVRTRGGGVRTRGGGVQTRGDGVRTRGGGVRTKGGGVQTRGGGVRTRGGHISDDPHFLIDDASLDFPSSSLLQHTAFTFFTPLD